MPQKKHRASNGSGRKATKTASGQVGDLTGVAEQVATFDERRTAPESVSEEAVRTRAYYLFLERGGRTGHELDDWLRAEHEFRP